MPQLVISGLLICGSSPSAFDHRIRFVSPQGQNSQPTHSNVIVYLGENTRRFIEVFSEIGVVAGRL
jgi:hypothetical protein